ncbi:MAG: HPr(Ser) kinase/phosphatase, partial [Kiritimatiellia bacterium]|nr:HPr(Ser) kinase/phosphatase [Kiritimatiellia bacterium]
MLRMAETPRITVANFFEAGQSLLELEWEANADKAVGREIVEVALNRPGLALAGFQRYFAYRRIQVLGLAEMAYMSSLRPEERQKRYRILRNIPAAVLSRSRHMPVSVRKSAVELGIPVMRTHLVTGHFMNAATVLLQNMASPRVRAAGTMIEINGMGVLLEGQPGIGKSEIALALIKRGHSLVADDTTILTRDSTGAIQGAAVEITREHMEIRGLGIIHVPRLFGVSSIRGGMRLNLIIRMIKPTADDEEIDRTGLDTTTRNVLGIEIPLV